MSYKALIFDFNGVLLWDSILQQHVWKQFSVAKRGKVFSEREIEMHVHGRNNRHTLEYLTGRKLSDDEAYTLMQQKEETYRNACLMLGDAFKLSPGAIELLTFLENESIPHTIATASEITNMRFFFDNLDLYRWFSFEEMVYDDGKRPGKPAPDIYLQAAANLRQSPSDCVVIEDSISGLQAATSAGIGWLVAIGPVEKHPALRDIHGVKQTVENLRQIDAPALFL